MAHIEIWYRCPCGAHHKTQKEAVKCAAGHVRAERWAVGKGGKAVRIFENWSEDSMHGASGALREADLSDFIEERRRQLDTEKKQKQEKKDDKNNL